MLRDDILSWHASKTNQVRRQGDRVKVGVRIRVRARARVGRSGLGSGSRVRVRSLSEVIAAPCQSLSFHRPESRSFRLPLLTSLPPTFLATFLAIPSAVLVTSFRSFATSSSRMMPMSLPQSDPNKFEDTVESLSIPHRSVEAHRIGSTSPSTCVVSPSKPLTKSILHSRTA